MSQSSRREFLKVGFVSAAVGVGAAGLTLLGERKATAADTNLVIPPWPWLNEYTPLDVEETRKLGHLGYYEGHCCYGAFKAIIGQLGEIVGSPFDIIPLDMMRHGAGGMVGFGSLCGCLNGAAAAIGLICHTNNSKPVISDLMSWYAAAQLPTVESNGFANGGGLVPASEMKSAEVLPTSVAGGNLCHMSVTNWCLASGMASGSSERAERCARIAGDVAAKAVELLNAVYDGYVLSGYPLPADSSSCRSCHSKGKDYDAGQFTRGKMDCEACHVDLKQVRSAAHHKGHTKKK